MSTLTTLDPKPLAARIDSALGELITTLESLSQEKINVVPFEGSWTAAQLGRHIEKSAINLSELLNGPTRPADRQADEKIEGIEKLFLDFSTKMSSPDFIIPEEREYDKQELITSLERIRTDAVDAANTLELSEICTSFSLPNSGEFTRYEWISFVAIHTTRHNHQLKNIVSKLESK